MDKYLLLRILLNLFELLACVTGFLHWKRVQQTIWKWFVLYLAVIVLAEIGLEYIGYALDLTEINISITVYFLIPFEFLFFLLLFYFWFDKRKARLWILACIIIYIISFVVDIVFLRETRFWFFSFSYTIGNAVLLIAEFLFFNRFINSREILHYRTSMMFWTGTGLLIFYMGSLPFYALWNTLVVHYPNVFNNYWIVVMCLNCIMYLFFCFAFIWGKPK